MNSYPNLKTRATIIDLSFKPSPTRGTGWLPMTIAALGVANTGVTPVNEPVLVTSASQVKGIYGAGSPAHQMAKKLFPSFGPGVGTIPVYFVPTPEAVGAAAATATISATGTSTAEFTINISLGGLNLDTITIASGVSSTAVITSILDTINDVLDSPVTATEDAGTITLTSVWSDVTANDIILDISYDATAGISITTSPFAGGAGVPAVSNSLALLNDVWYTLLINPFGLQTAVLDEISTVGISKWDSLEHKPFVAFAGSVEKDVAVLKAITDTRRTDYVNAVMPAPGSYEMPFSIAAAAVADIAIMADRNAAVDFALTVVDIAPGKAEDQWTKFQNNTAMTSGICTLKYTNGLYVFNDTVTMYHPEGEDEPKYRYVVDIIKLMNVNYQIYNKFENVAWAGSPLIDEDQDTINIEAKKPSTYAVATAAIIRNLGRLAVLRSVETSVESIAVDFGSTTNPNAKRVNISARIALSGFQGISYFDIAWSLHPLN